MAVGCRERIPETDALQSIDYFGVRSQIKGVSILPDGAWKKKWLLTETAYALSYQRSVYEGYILSVNLDLA